MFHISRWVVVICLIVFTHSATALPFTSVINPLSSQIFTTSVIPIACNATDTGELTSITLFHNVTGSFSANMTRTYGEAIPSTTTLLLCNWNNNLTCSSGEIGTNTSTSFDSGKYSQAVHISNTLSYLSTNNIDFDQGTIEFWVNLGTAIDPGTDYYFLHMGSPSTGSNELAIYVSSGRLHFSIWDLTESTIDVSKSIDMVSGNWYHVAAVWDLDTAVSGLDHMELYLNASNASNSYSGTDNTISVDSIPLRIYLGSDDNGGGQGETVLDDLHIFSDVHNRTQINDSFQRGFANLTAQVANWSLLLADGSYQLGCTAQDNQSFSASSSNVTFFVDAQTSPSLSSLYTFPNSTDVVDPGVVIQVNATLSDISGVASASLGYRRAGVSTWTNVTMVNSSLGWGANFTASLPPGIWEYRVWSNDSLGREGYSAVYNITADYDYSWNLTPTAFGNTLLYIGSTGSVGTLLINNTGDYPLTFDLSSSYSSTFFNISEPFDLSAGTFITVNVTATASLTPSETAFIIYTNTTTSGASPTSLNTTAIVTSYVGGPHLDVSIETYSSSVAQGQLINLSARVKNIGNETATMVWINWTIPSGWSNTSGYVQLFVGNMSSGSYNITNLTFILSSSAAAGVRTIVVNATSFENKTDEASQAITVLCSSSDNVCGAGCTNVDDSDCSVSQGGGGSGGGGSSDSASGGGGSASPRQPLITHLLTIHVPQTIVVLKNASFPINLSVQNDGNNSIIKQVSIAVAGLPGDAIETVTQFDLGQKEHRIVWITFTLPSYLTYGPHPITFTAQAVSSDYNETMRIPVFAQVKSTLVVTSSDAPILEHDLLSLSSTILQKNWREAKDALDGYDYDRARIILADLKNAEKKIDDINDIYASLQSLLDEAVTFGLSTTETRRLLELSESALSRGDLDRALDRAQNARLTAEIEVTGRLSSARWYKNAWSIGPFVLVILIVTAGGVHRLGIRRARFLRHARLVREEDVIVKKIRDLQVSAFQKQTIPLSTYRLLMRTYQDRLGRVQRSLGGSRTQRIKDLQRSYFGGSIGRATYRRLLRQLRVAPLLILFIPLVSADIFTDASQAISDIGEQNLPTHRLSDVLDEAIRLRENNNSVAAESTAGYVLSLKDTIIHANSLLNEVESILVDKNDLQWEETRTLFVAGERAFREERFEDAERLLGAALDRAETILASPMVPSVLPIPEWSPIAAVGVIILLSVSFIVSHSFRSRRRLAILKNKSANMDAHLRVLQRAYFDGSCSREDYLQRLHSYHTQRANIENEIAMHVS